MGSHFCATISHRATDHFLLVRLCGASRFFESDISPNNSSGRFIIRAMDRIQAIECKIEPLYQMSIFEYFVETAVHWTLIHQFQLPWQVHRYTSYKLLSSASCSDFFSFWDLAYHRSDRQCSNFIFNTLPGSIGMVTMRIRYQITVQNFLGDGFISFRVF